MFLRSASDYNYLSHSNCLRIDGVDDAKKFSVLVVKLIASTEIVLALYLIVAYAISLCAGCLGYYSDIEGRPNEIVFYGCSCLMAGEYFVLCNR
jgi:hypothetical protein